MTLLECYQKAYFEALQSAGIPINAQFRTPGQQSQATMIFLAVSMEAGSLVSITQAGLEAA